MACSLTQEIARLRAIVNGGVSSVNIDGTSTSIDVSAAARRLRELESEQRAAQGRRPRRSMVKQIDLGGC